MEKGKRAGFGRERRNRREQDNIRAVKQDREELEKTWVPKTRLGKMVKNGEIKSMDEILIKGTPIKEAGITDYLLPDLEMDLMLIGQSKGKFGGGRRRAFRQTQKKTEEGNVLSFSTFVVIGNKDGYVGMGTGKAKETVPAREKAIRNAKMNLIRIKRGCGSWECGCKEPHSIPFKVEGKCASVKVILLPAPKGVGLCVHEELKKILAFAGIKDVWSRSFGATTSRINLIKACFNALKQLSATKTTEIFDDISGTKGGML
ncbi:MAG: 30S ribosomal protein S5 [Candidatus Nanoarchaeia archaeon]|nr:30S ribosomal protein S5 [Candidatus Nanoarchaeia archaeon]